MTDSSQERRREVRRAASGPATFMLPDPLQPRTVQGSLIDVSDHGFRVSHAFAGLTCGQEVGFEYEGRRGRARVAWTRVTADGVESGFFILQG